MITRKQRQFYAITVGVIFALGNILYGGLALISNMTPVIVYAILGGMLPGGLASGIILVGRFMRQRKSTVLIVLACVLAPVTMLVIMAVGVYGVIPYYIYNLVLIKKTKAADIPQHTVQTAKRTKKTVWIVALCIIAGLMIANTIGEAISDSMIAQEVFAKTGYAVGSPDHVILKEYYYHDGVLEDGEYEYVELDGVLFALARRGSEIDSNIYYSNKNGGYARDVKTSRSAFSTGTFMRHDIDRLFTRIQIKKSGEVYALMLTIDARRDDEHIWHIDRTYADVHKLTLTDENGESIQTMTDGKYTVYCGVMLEDNNDYKLIVSYKGDTYTLLTYEDITAFNITNNQ